MGILITDVPCIRVVKKIMESPIIMDILFRCLRLSAFQVHKSIGLGSGQRVMLITFNGFCSLLVMNTLIVSCLWLKFPEKSNLISQGGRRRKWRTALNKTCAVCCDSVALVMSENEMYTRRTKGAPPMQVDTQVDRWSGAVLRSECRHRLKWKNLTMTAKMQIGFWNRLLLTCVVLCGWRLFWISWRRNLSVSFLTTCVKKDCLV